MNMRLAALALPLALGLACTENPAAPNHPLMLQQQRKGTGLILQSVTGVNLPLLGQLGDVTIDQAEITNFALVENTVGAIVGLQAEGVLQLTGGVLGSDVVTLDLGPIDINALVAQVDVPAATLTGRGSGAVGSLLCNLGQLLNPATQGVRGVVQALNHLI